MRRNVEFTDLNTTTIGNLSSYQEIAIYVRELLQSEFALLAVPKPDSVRIESIAGADRKTSPHIVMDLISRLSDWGPVIIDESRAIAAPMWSRNRIVAVLVGYSSTAGAFTTDDLERLTAYCDAASGIVANLLAEAPETRTTFTTDELRHFSRLITVGQLSTRFAQELMNPLTLIRGHLQVVEESLSTEESFRTNFEVVDRASRRIEEMAKRMLEFSKKRVRCTESWRVEEIISEVLRFIQPCIRRPFVETQV